MKRMCHTFVLTLMLTAASGAEEPSPDCYVAKMIQCPSDDEQLIVETFHIFDRLAAGETVKSSELKLPLKSVKSHGENLIFSRSYYITPNELRGFELVIPKTCLSEQGKTLISNTELCVESSQMKQNHLCLVLKRGKAPSL